MKISYNWLKKYIDVDLPAENVAEKLTLSGLEVEETEIFGSNFDGFVVGEVLKVIEHPFADKLKLCKVNLGTEEVQIVCGAKNVTEGQKVAVATVGSSLPVPAHDGSKVNIKKTKIRGEESAGMICSEGELGLSEDRSGIMVLNDDLKAGEPLSVALDAVKDTVFEIGLTPNRPDASCHIGVARDLGAVLHKNIENPYNFELPNSHPLSEWIDVRIEDTKQCHRYAGKIVKNIKVGESPGWLRNKLRSIGLRPVNNVVDLTNYVLHEIGQPLHAFDYDRIEGKKIVVKSFNKSHFFKTLDGIKREVPAGILFICDQKKPVALAGIMGGINTEVTEDTRTVFIESAYFEPSSVRKSSKKLGLQTDSSYRFERGIDPNLARRACERAARLIAEYCNGEVVSGCTDIHPVITSQIKILLRIKRLNQLLGTSLDIDSVTEILNALEIETKTPGTDQLECLIPTFRPDITREVDLIEEVGRIFDYNNIPKPVSTPFLSPAPLDTWETMHNRVRTIASRLGYKEITTNSLHSAEDAGYFSESGELIKTLNPVSQEATTLRTTLLTGFLKVLQFNLNRNADQLRFFETGHVYKRSGNGTWINGIEEHSKLLLGVCGSRNSEIRGHHQENYSVFDLKSDLESFLQQLGVFRYLETDKKDNEQLNYSLGGNVIAELKQIPEPIADKFDINLPAYAAEIDLTLLHRAGFHSPENQFSPVPKFPSFEYDVAYTVDLSVTAGEMAAIIRKTAEPILHNLKVFDVYEGKNLGIGKKSIAFRLTFLDRNKTLNINDVEPVVKNITQVLETELGAKLRS